MTLKQKRLRKIATKIYNLSPTANKKSSETQKKKKHNKKNIQTQNKA